METIDGKLLNVPLSNRMHHFLNEMFAKTQSICTQKAQEYIKEAEVKQEDFVNDFKELSILKDYRSVLQFFVDKELLSDAKLRLETFETFVDMSFDQIEDSKKLSSMDQVAKSLLHFFNEVNNALFNKEYGKLVKVLFELVDFIEL